MAKANTGPDFKSLLSKPLDTMERPVGVPGGTYFGVIKNAPFGKSRFDKNITTIDVNITITGATEDVDPGELKDADGKDLDLSKVRAQTQFQITAEKMYIFNDFLESLGFDTAGKPADEFLHELPGKDVLVTLTNTTSENGKDSYNNVKRVVGA
jgi:hypothetical protein